VALVSVDALKAMIAMPHQLSYEGKILTAGTGKQEKFASVWNKQGDHIGANPSTAVAPTSSTAGAWTKSDAGSGRQIIIGGSSRQTNNTPGNAGFNGGGYSPRPLLIIDRVSHQGGLDGNVNTTQTTNFPTAALTRYTSGVGVMAAIETHAAIGATATNVTISYTNTAGTSGHTGVLVCPSLSLNSIGIFIPIPLQAGDLGVKSVENVTLSAATGTVGNWGITLFKVVGFIWADGDGTFSVFENAFWNEEILDSACLQMLEWGLNGGSGFVMRHLTFAEC
jgi:hypothetical protein